MIDPGTLVARTRPLGPDEIPDLLSIAGSNGYLFARNGIGFAGHGVAARIPVAAAADWLAQVATDHHDLGGPVAFGALPFRPDPGTDMVVPTVTVGVDDTGAGWVTSVTSIDGHPPGDDPVQLLAEVVGRPGRPSPADGPSSFEVRAVRPPADWQDAVARATESIRNGRVDKVVLAREVLVTADLPISVSTVLLRLAQHHPGCYLYLVDGFCGASPELLVSRAGDVVRAQPMAGTKPRRGDPTADAALAAELLASATYRHEHQVTIDAVHDTLLAFCSYVDYEPEPSVVPLSNVVHLATQVEGRLSHPPASVLELVEALHPTPAVCGRPRQGALALIAELESLDRGRYAGAVGWVDARGNGQWAVSIRGAEIHGDTARVIAGNGVVADSDPPTELIETRAKLQAMLSAIVRP